MIIRYLLYSILKFIIFCVSVPFWIAGFAVQVLLDAFNGGRDDWKNF